MSPQVFDREIGELKVNIAKIVSLAKSNNLVLAKYSVAWATTKKCGDPVVDAIWTQNYKLWARVGFAVSAIVGWLFLSNDWLISFLLTMIIPFMITVIGIISKDAFKNAGEFCEAISILEKNPQIGSFEKGPALIVGENNPWEIDFLLKNHAENILKSKAEYIMKLERFPWRKNEATKQRKILSRMFKLLSGLVAAEKDWSYYFVWRNVRQ